MKTILLLPFLCLTLNSLALSQQAQSIALQPHNDATASKLVQDYHDVLAHIPADLKPTKPKEWTSLQRDDANTALKGDLIENETKARLVLEVVDVPDWNGWTFYANISNKEGYPIRVFGKFTDEWKQKFKALKKGESVVLEGTLNSVTYRQLWGRFTLSICLRDCTFTKPPTKAQPNITL